MIGDGVYDALVIGGGPAGAMTAYHLARRGAKVALLEARTFPRAKACGGGLQARIRKHIPFDLSPVLRGAIHRVGVSFGMGSVHHRNTDQPLMHTVLRSEFDDYLLRQAAAAGTAVHEGVSCRSIDAGHATHVRVETNRGEYRARCVAGADGANSVARSLLNGRSDYFWQAAVYCEIPAECLEQHGGPTEGILVDWGTLPSGYAWAFPKRGFVNVGAGGPMRLARLLRAYALQFARHALLLRAGAVKTLRFAGHQLPTLTNRTRLAGRNVLLVGDAAGCVEPFTGDGISFACQSAEMAAEEISESLAGTAIDLRGYQRRVFETIGEELTGARKLLSLSAVFPSLPYRLFRDNTQVWESFCRLAHGDYSFARLRRDVLGPFGFAMRAIDCFAACWERFALRRPIRPALLADSQSSGVGFRTPIPADDTRWSWREPDRSPPR